MRHRHFGRSKARQYWLWFLYHTITGGILAYTFKPRTVDTCRELQAQFSPLNIDIIKSDDWKSYIREEQKERHLTGKIFTQRIDRSNLTLTTRVKRLAQKNQLHTLNLPS
ncbi:TPA: hypothetical protein QHR58_004505 [Enterobacter kobei]|nr:hypothetical protein [Enterobacter kobei]